jgi:hypothetical protein
MRLLNFIILFFCVFQVLSQAEDIHELKKNITSNQIYVTEGFVVDISHCTCRVGVNCEPCQDNIVISESNKIQKYINEMDLSNQDLRVFLKNPDSYKNFFKGRKYQFVVQKPSKGTMIYLLESRILSGYE